MRHVEERADGAGHAVDDRDRRIVERDARFGGGDGHLRARLDVVGFAHTGRQALEDALGGGERERLRERLCLARGVGLDSVAERIEAGRVCDACGCGEREGRVDDGDLGDERSASDKHLHVCLRVRDDSELRGLGAGAGGGGDGDHGAHGAGEVLS